MQKSNSVTQTVESLEKTHYRICFSDLITWVTTPSQSATSNDILLRPDIKTINQTKLSHWRTENQHGRTRDPIARFQRCIRLPDGINNAWTVQSHYCNQIRPLYSNKNNKSTEAAEPLPRTKNTEPQIKSVEINDKLPTKLVLKPNYHHVRGSRTSTECIKLINRHEFIRPESESAKMQNYESKRAFRCRYEYLDYSHIPDNTTDRNNSRGKPRLRR